MAITTGSLPELYEPWVTDIYMNEHAQLETLYTQLFNVKPISTAFADTFEVGGFGTFVLKPEGKPVAFDDPVQSLRKRVMIQTFALGFRQTMEAMADEQHNILGQMPKDMARSERDHKENLAWGVLNDAFAGATYTGLPEGDGTRRALCATGHIRLKDGGTSSNRASVAFGVAGLEDAITNFRLTQDASGRRTPLTPQKVVHHPNDEWTVFQVLDSTQEPYTADNQSNSVKASRLGLSSLSSPYLTDDDAWFLCAPKEQHSICWYNRMDTAFERNKDAATKDAMYDAIYRAQVTFDGWRGIYGSAP
jgi:hypothetical protein